jgi:hypothetical protein
MPSIISKVLSLIISLWIAKVFLSSLPYKFTNHPDTQHIFQTIGQWLNDFLPSFVGDFFANYAAYIIGSVELVASCILLLASAIWIFSSVKVVKKPMNYRALYFVAGLLSSATMSGAAFFHLFTPLGIVVIHNGKSDEGSLFFAAVSILILGLILAAINNPRSADNKRG